MNHFSTQPSSTDEVASLRRLNVCAFAPDALRYLESIAYLLRHSLAESHALTSAHAVIPLETYAGPLPGDVKSSWIFVLRKHTAFEPERHPNSIQRMFALSGPGIMETWHDGAWRQNVLVTGAGQGGLSIPAFAWHRPGKLACDWAVVSFHTVPAQELVEQLGDPVRGVVHAARVYEGKDG
jgi:hypothetical protein